VTSNENHLEAHTVSEQRLGEIIGFAIVTADLPRLVRFYCEVLGFAAHEAERRLQPTELALLGLRGAGRRRVLSLGRQTVWIDEFEPAGRAYPAASDASSLVFQHLALVVSDMPAAYARLRGITPISRDGPQTLPPASGGARAFKFRDPDGHPLELLQFPPGKTPDAWKNARPLEGQIGIGIDHSAISVANADTSTVFYRVLGLRAGKRNLNQGPAQERLDGIQGIEVAVIPMMPIVETPHLELLGYHLSKNQQAPVSQVNDVAATRIVWRGGTAELIRDPDGHLQQIEAEASATP
jgi:catechol 2,3-dioxygenase-like lactoylglutathione lyase family enzyme